MLADDEAEEVDHVKGVELKGWKVFLFFLPAACDVAGTTVSNLQHQTDIEKMHGNRGFLCRFSL